MPYGLFVGSVGGPTVQFLLRKPGGRPAGAAHSMRASAQVTAPGAATSIIVAVSTRPNRQNRSTCSRMSVPLVQKQKLGLVNRKN
jgi:hypothetical protein